jgi:putative oxidoreductase
MALSETCAAWRPYVLSIIRIIVALLLLQHGLSKFFGFPVPWPAGGGAPAMFTLYWWAGAIEIVGSVLLALGLFTRPVAFILAGELAAAYFIGHAPQSFYPQVNRGEAAILFSFIFFYIFVAGPGPWSIDAMRGSEK